jgi:hypothetical protein
MAGRKNRKLRCQNSKNYRWWPPILFVVVIFFTCIGIDILFDRRCQVLIDETARLEKENKLEESNYERELSRWNELRTLRRLEAALRKHCLDMKYPSPDRVVLMDADGKPKGNPRTLTRAMSRLSRVENTASISHNSRPGRVRR